jgi:hypothetical protein
MSSQPFRNETETLAYLLKAVKRLDGVGSESGAGGVGGLGGGYTGGDLYVTGKLEIPEEAPSMTNQEILSAIFKWSTSLLTANAASGQKDVVVADASEFSEGAGITIIDSNHSEACTIDSIAGNTLTMVDNLTYTYTTVAYAEVYDWTPSGFATPNRVLRFKDNISLNYLNHFLITNSEDDDNPLHVLDQGVVFKKDVAAGGFLSANQGMLWLGHGLNTPHDPPKIVAGHTYSSLLTGTAASGQKNISVANAAGFQVGYPIVLEDDDHSEHVIIASIVGNVVTVQQNLAYSYTTAANAVLYEPYDVINITKHDGSTLARFRLAEILVDSLKTSGDADFVFELVNMPNQGDSGKVLTAAGTGNPPTWETPSGGSVVTDDDCVAGAGGVEINHIVSITGDDTVSLASRANATGVHGVAAATATAGNPASVITVGRAQVVAGEDLVAGDRVTTDDSGHAIKYSGHNHSIGKSTASFSTSLHSHVVAPHTHTMSASSAGSFSTSSHSHVVAPHTHTISSENPSTSGADYNALAVTSVTALGYTLSYVGGTTDGAAPTNPHSHGFSGGAAVDLAHGHGVGTASFSTSAHSHVVASHSHGGATGSANPSTSGADYNAYALTGIASYTGSANPATSGADFNATAVTDVDAFTGTVATGEVEWKVLVGATSGNLATVYVR